MKRIELEAGKTYLKRNGKTVRVTRPMGPHFPFEGGYHSYRMNGKAIGDGLEEHDIIAEAGFTERGNRVLEIIDELKNVPISTIVQSNGGAKIKMGSLAYEAAATIKQLAETIKFLTEDNS